VRRSFILAVAMCVLAVVARADQVTLKNGDILYYYLDPDTFLEIRRDKQEFIRGSVHESVMEMGSYKPVAGVMYPFSLSQGSKANPSAQTINVEKLEANVTIPEADFALPASLKPGAKPDAAQK